MVVFATSTSDAIMVEIRFAIIMVVNIIIVAEIWIAMAVIMNLLAQSYQNKPSNIRVTNY